MRQPPGPLRVEGVLNFRSVDRSAGSAPLLYRCASLDALTVAGAESLLAAPSPLLQGRALGAVIDLRNADEVARAVSKRTEGAELLYSRLRDGDGDGRAATTSARLCEAPFLGEVRPVVVAWVRKRSHFCRLPRSRLRWMPRRLAAH